MKASAARVAVAVVIASLLGGCAGSLRDGAPRSGAANPALPPDAIPRNEPPSRYGNGPVYEVFGKRYAVMPSSAGYSERGVASWYGKKFHGRLTSSREPYDMHRMTAAHKTLPLPSYVRVRNLRNDKSIVVRVNDRGPFVHNRIIDLSYAAARKLDMIRDGTSLVEVTAISFDEAPGGRPPDSVVTTGPAPPGALPAPLPGRPRPVEPAQAADTEAPVDGAGNEVFVQVGAFGSVENAERRHRLLLDRGIANSRVHTDTSVTPALYRVRIGPIVEVAQYDVLVEELERLGIVDPYLVTE